MSENSQTSHNLFNCNNMVDPIKRIILKHPKDAFINQNKVDSEYRSLNFFGAPDLKKSLKEFKHFTKILNSFEIKLHFIEEDDLTTIDSIYTHDPLIVSNSGVIICNMGKKNRNQEKVAIKNFLKSENIPILGEITAPGKLEGGDVVWINKNTIAVGIGYRTNMGGIKQLSKLLNNIVKEIIPVPLPHWNGPKDCLHLMSNLSPIDHNLFLVYPRLLPVSFIEYLLKNNIELINVPDEEYETMACNVLAIAPKEVIMVEGNPLTKNLLEKSKVKVHTYKGSEISLKGSGGPTCLTKPLFRIPLNR
ncbi:MAG: dimethylarginine dimethylaminohydrolase family protein [Candidatus Neomarinimicrobiota bacterium]